MNAERIEAIPSLPSVDPSLDGCMIEWDKAIAQAFWAKADTSSGLSACWPWLGKLWPDGYGRFNYEGKSYRAARVAYELANNKRLPESMLACHTCDNPVCINPRHIFSGTHRDNMIDYIQKYGHQSRHVNLQTKPRVSEISKLELSRRFPEVYTTVMELENAPKPIATACYQGIHLKQFMYLGLKRNGENYLDTWLRENHVSISHKAMTIAKALAFYREFTTYDMLLDFLKDHDWGLLQPDKLSDYPKQTTQEEKADRPKEEPATLPKSQTDLLIEKHYRELRK